jgi:mannosyltransferase
MAIPHNLVSTRWQLSSLSVWVRHHAVFVLGALLFVVALVLRLYRLGAQSLWLDEGGTWFEITSKSWPDLLGELVSEKAAYPLYHLLLKAWVSLAGDSEWALRFPSALAGAATAVVIYLAAIEIQGNKQHATGKTFLPFTFYLLPSLLLATSPFALWHAQDAKVYSLLMLVVALELWALLRALWRPTRRAWALVLSVAILSLFVHRLALLSAAGAALAYVIAGESVVSSPLSVAEDDHGPRTTDHGRWSISRISLAVLALVLAAGGVVGTILAVRGENRAAGGHIPAAPLQALWLTFVRFSLDRWPGDIGGYLGLPLAVWLLPFAVLTI